MRRGEVRLVDLEPVRGAEADKRRPAVIVSNDGANSTAQRLRRGVVTVVPVTSNVTRVYPFQVLLTASAGRAKVKSSNATIAIRLRKVFALCGMGCVRCVVVCEVKSFEQEVALVFICDLSFKNTGQVIRRISCPGDGSFLYYDLM